jgi:large subunit ribosomal protein L4
MVVIDELSFQAPKTREFAGILQKLKIDRSCLVATAQYDENVYKSLRNVPRVDMLEAGQLNAGAILRHQKLLLTRGALEQVLTPAAEVAAAGATS